jgi:hypothetical protein
VGVFLGVVVAKYFFVEFASGIEVMERISYCGFNGGVSWGCRVSVGRLWGRFGGLFPRQRVAWFLGYWA